MIGQLEGLLRLNADLNSQIKPVLRKTIAFVSGKGGTGKSLLAVNIAKYLTSKGKKVLLVDLNFNFSNTAVMINSYASKTLYSFFTRRAFLRELIIKEENGISFLYGDSGKAEFPEIDKSISALFIKQLAELEAEYDLIILDSASGAGKEIFNFLRDVTSFLIITSTEPTAIMDAYVMIKLLKENSCNGKKNVVINKCFDDSDGKTAFNNLNSANEHFLRESLNYIGSIDFSNEIGKSVINQNIFIENHPGHKSAHQIAVISTKLLEIAQLANINQD